MLRHVDSIRKQICEASINSFRYAEGGDALKKGVKPEELMKMLYFKEGEESEFEDFLSFVGAYRNTDGYITQK